MNSRIKLFLLLVLACKTFIGFSQSDEPCTATELTVGQGGACTNPVNGCINPVNYTNSTSASSGVTLPLLTCNGFSATTKDFWFKATVPGSGKLNIRVTISGRSNQITLLYDMALYTSSDPTNCAGSVFTQIGSECTGSRLADTTITQPAGTVVFIRLFKEGATSQSANRCFSICVKDPPTAVPSCVGIIAPVDGATNVQSPVTPLSWHSSPTASSYIVRFGSTFPGDSLTTIPDTTVVLNTNTNTNYYWSIIPVNEIGAASGCPVNSFTTFPPQPVPANDSCSTATTIIANTRMEGTTFGATQSMSATCGSYNGIAKDVWYKLIPAQNGNAMLRVSPVSNTFDIVVVAYSGNCDTLVSFKCQDQNLAGIDEVVALNNLVTNKTYWIRVYGYGIGGPEGTFSLTAAGSALESAHFRSAITGTWNNTNTWQSSNDSISWVASVVVPDSTARSVIIQRPNEVTVNQNTVIDKTTVMPGALISVMAGATVTVKNGGLVLRSTADSMGSIGLSVGQIIGDATIERFLPARRSWRMMHVPITGAQTIRESWQENGSTASGYGTHITGGIAADGFDQSPTNSPSILTYDAAQNKLVPISSTNNAVSGNSYMVFVRGDRTINLTIGSAAPATNTILRVKGTPRMGSQTPISVAPAGFTLIGNPYASSIDFTLLDKTNIATRFYLWDPKRASVGSYVLFDEANNYEPLVAAGSYSGTNTVINQGQAFFVESNGTAGNVTFKESSKSTSQKNVFRTSAVNDPKLQFNLNLVDQNNTVVIADAAAIRFNDAYTAVPSAEDAGKLDNIGENIAIVNANRLLTIERRPFVKTGDSISLKIYNTQPGNYRLDILASNFAGNEVAYIYDDFLKTTTPINITSNTSLPFSITSNAASSSPFRFSIVFKPAITLPLYFTLVRGYIQNRTGHLEWTIAGNKDVEKFDVEKSIDGEHFSKASIIKAGNEKDFSWSDPSLNNGNNFYRIVAKLKNGEIKTSNTITLKLNAQGESIAVFPNPVKGKIFSVQLEDKDQGLYQLQLFNISGQLLFSKLINYSGGTSVNTIQLPQGFSSGLYSIRISRGDDVFQQRLIVD